MSNLPNKWGPTSTQKDYEFFMAGSTPASPPISLLEHALTSPSQELTDPVTAPVQRKVGGRIQTINKIIRPGEQNALTYTLLFPSALWTPALQAARRGSACPTDFFAKRLCPENPDFRHLYIYPDARLDPPKEVGDFITNTTDTEVLTEETTLRTTHREILFWLKLKALSKRNTAVNSVAFKQFACTGCNNDALWMDMFAGERGATDAPPRMLRTSNRFSSVTVVNTPAPNNSVIEDIYTDGEVVIAAFSDGAGVASGTSGGTVVSFDGGVTYTIDSPTQGITAPMYGVTRFGGRFIAVGGTGTGAGLIHTSTNGVVWDTVSAAAIPATHALTEIDIDEENNVGYVVGEGGTLLRISFTGGDMVVESLSSRLPGSPGTLTAVRVLSPGHVMVGGANAYLAESFDQGETWRQPGIAGSAAIAAIAGDKYRVLVGVGANVFERSLLVDEQMAFTAVALPSGVSGNVTDIIMAGGDRNYFAITTASGDIVLATPPYPNA